MSQKITSKNLSYDESVPPFLAALRAQASGARGPDPLLAAQRRSAKKRSDSEEAEDAPLVVDEEGNVVNVEVDKDGVVTESKEQDTETQVDGLTKEVKKEVGGKAAIGGRKRKAGKVVGEAAEEAVTKEDDKKAKRADAKDGVKDRKPKKAKKIKLSFDQDDG